jgi:Ternary complex associated domain 9
MTTTSPIDLALKAVSKLFSDTPPDLAAYTDDSSTKLETLVGELTNPKNTPHPVLIRMGTKEAKKRQPYAELLQQTLKEKNLGVYGSIHSIVAALVKSMPASTTKTETLPNFTKCDDLKAGDIEIYVEPNSTETDRATESRKTATQSLLNWAQLESCLDAPTTSFSLLAGGIRPLVYVFDDYNNFIADSQEEFYQLQTPEVITKEIRKFYGRSSSSNALDLESAIRGFGRCLNTLSLVFDVKAPNIKFDGDLTNRYEIVAEKLNFQRLDKDRNQIAAFIIDLEWLPEPDWIEKNPDDTEWGKRQPEEMGHIAIRLLTQRYPEIPCFVFTGLWSIEILQKSLAAGAAWCFQKPASHHIGSNNDPNYQPEEELNYFNLERHLTEFAKLNYGAYDKLPNSDQFDTISHPAIINKIVSKAEISFTRDDEKEENHDHRYLGGENLKKLIARQFTADSIQPIKVLDAGRSGAKATFFAKVFNNSNSTPSVRVPDATRFVKMDSWFTMQSEYFAYQNIIRPKLNNHVAHIIQKPSCTVNSLSPEGMIVSSLAGFPEDFSKLKTLQQLIHDSLYDSAQTDIVCEKIACTLKLVLLPLYQNPQEKSFWMGETYAPIWNGKIEPLSTVKLDEDRDDSPTIDNIYEIIKYLEDKAILENSNTFRLQNWHINRIRTSSGGTEITLSHPKLGRQIKLKGDKEDLRRRFNSLWIRPGMSIDVKVFLESHDRVIEKNHNEIDNLIKKSFDQIPTSIALLQKWHEWTKEKPLDPFEILKYQCQIKGLFGTIHGDLNANNILYPDNENTGFLIDFANTKNEGLIAFDLSSLEERVWRHHLIPRLLLTAKNLALCPDRPDETILKILHLCLKSSDFHYGDLSLFESKIRGIEGCQSISMDLFLPITNALKIIHSIREFALTQMKPSISINDPQMCYALGTAFLLRVTRSIEHKSYHPDILSQSQVLIYLCASYYLSKFVGNENPPS